MTIKNDNDIGHKLRKKIRDIEVELGRSGLAANQQAAQLGAALLPGNIRTALPEMTPEFAEKLGVPKEWSHALIKAVHNVESLIEMLIGLMGYEAPRPPVSRYPRLIRSILPPIPDWAA